MQRFDVSRATVRKALDALVDQGLVYRVQGRGTFIRGRQRKRAVISLGSLFRDAAALGRHLTNRVTQIERQTAGAALAGELGLEQGADVIYVEQLRLLDGIPLSFDMEWLPKRWGEAVVQEDLSVYSIIDLLEERCGLRLGEATYRIEAAAAEGRVASALKVRNGHPILQVERTDYSLDEVPILHHRWHSRTDNVHFSLQLKQQ
jgi:GntR family transcriptional regulator